MSPILAYWNMRGLAQPIRLLLAYTETDFEDKTYTDYVGRSDWAAVKFTLGLDFPNLPYYMDGEVKMTQSNAILRYLARQHGLCGATLHQTIRVDMLENHAMDMRRAYDDLAYHTYDTHKDEYVQGKLKQMVKGLSDFLADRPWFAGDHITFPDFLIYELLYVNLKIDDSCLKDATNLQQFFKRFEELPAIKKYMASPKYFQGPLNAPTAKFGVQ